MNQPNYSSDAAPVESAPNPPATALAMIPRQGRITTMGRRLYNALLKLAKEQGLDQPRHEVSLQELSSLLNFDRQDLETLKRTLNQLISTAVEWQSAGREETQSWDACSLLASASVKKDTHGDASLVWTYEQPLREHLLDSTHYASLSLQVSGALRSHAALALYEICLPIASRDPHLTDWQTWTWWHPVLTGNTHSRPAQYRYFKRDVLLPAIARINSQTDVEIRRLVETKAPDNKTITGIQFEAWLRRQDYQQAQEAETSARASHGHGHGPGL